MLWKKHLSIYNSGTPKVPDHKRDISKTKTALAPLIVPSSPPTEHRTLDVSNPKFVIRKKSKSTKNIREQIPNTFYLHKGNNFQLVKAIFEQLGCVQTVNKETACIIWYQGKDMAKKDLGRKQVASKTVNYFPNHSEITNKQHLYQNLVKYRPDCVGDFVPKTYVVDFKETMDKVEACLTAFVIDYFRKTGASKPKRSHSLSISNYYGQACVLFSKVFKQLNDEHKQSYPEATGEKVRGNNELLWIVKPSFMNRGQGIKVISSLKQLQNILSEDSQQISIKMYQPEESTSPSSYIIQEYIMNPMLYQGYKFDLRVWMLLKKSKKEGLQVYLYRKGYARIAGLKYALTKETDPKQEDKNNRSGEMSPDKARKGGKKQLVTDPFMHLTNNAVQKNCKEYGEIHEGNQILIEDLVDKIAHPGLKTQLLFGQFERIAAIMIESCRQKLMTKASYGTFQLMGLDFMIDTALKVWLIEANCNPCLEQSSAMLKEVLPIMLKSLLKIVDMGKIMSNNKNPTSQDLPPCEQQSEISLWHKIQSKQ